MKPANTIRSILKESVSEDIPAPKGSVTVLEEVIIDPSASRRKRSLPLIALAGAAKVTANLLGRPDNSWRRFPEIDSVEPRVEDEIATRARVERAIQIAEERRAISNNDSPEGERLEDVRQFGEAIVERHDAIDMYNQHGMTGGFVEIAARDIELTDEQRSLLAAKFSNYVESNVGQIVVDTTPPR